MTTIPLSLTKITTFFEKYKYILQKVFVIDGKIKFLEVKSPVHKKIFFINIPDRYVLKNTGSLAKSTTIYESYEKKHLKTFVDMFKNIGLCIATISSKKICWFCNDEVLFYTFEKPLVEEVPDKETKEDIIVENLEEELKKVKSNVSTDPDIEFVKHQKDVGGDDQKDIDEIVLVFEDKDGNEIDNLEEIIEDIEKPKKVHIDKNTVADYTPERGIVIETRKVRKAKAKKEVNPNVFDEPETFSTYNEIPENFKDKKINIGIIYISINIDTFLKSAEGYEDVLIQQYKSIDEYEDKTREEKVLEIGDLVSQFRINSMEKLQNSREKEKDLKQKIERLTAILISCDNIRIKNPTSDVISVQQKTRNTLDELNLEILKIRDEMARFLRKCKEHLEDMAK